MAQLGVAYVLTFLLFAMVDITWLMTMGGKLYRETLGDILLPDIRYGPAAAFYAFYPAGSSHSQCCPACGRIPSRVPR